MELTDLEIYNLAMELSDIAWQNYVELTWQDKKVIGNQFISAVDSIGANIAEGFGRYHFADRNKFNYNARGSLHESFYWLQLLQKRSKISKEQFEHIKEKLTNLSVKLNNYILSTKKLKETS